MVWRWSWLALLVVFTVGIVGAPSWADTAGAGAGKNRFWSDVTRGNHADSEKGDLNSVVHPAGMWMSSPSTCDKSNVCHGGSRCADGSIRIWQWFQPSGEPSAKADGGLSACAAIISNDPRTLTRSDIAHAFKTIELPAARLVIQPPKGRTLVNFDTVFYTTQGSFRRSVRLLGHRVEFRIRPNEFSFVFGDGHWLTTRDRGRPFTTKAALARDITHRYLTKGVFHPSLETTYGADFRVDGGRWRAVVGTVTIQGPELDLEAVTATPVLVG